MAESKYSKYIITELHDPMPTPEARNEYSAFAKRILWMDNSVVKGAFKMNCSWYMKPCNHAPDTHTHKVDEILGFFGNNPEDPYDLGAEIEFWIEDEQFILTRSCMIFMPGGMTHCPLNIRKVDKPAFHFFTTVSTGKYELDIKKKAVEK